MRNLLIRALSPMLDVIAYRLDSQRRLIRQLRKDVDQITAKLATLEDREKEVSND